MSTSKAQVGRLLALVPYLQNRNEVRLDEAASVFGVSPEQMRNDLEVLWFCGYPGLGMGDYIEIDMDAVDGEGVVRLSNAEYLARPLRLGSSEAAALMVALRALREGASPEQVPAIDRALAKIEAAAGEAARTAGRVEVHAAPPEESVRRTLALVEGACGTGHQLRIDYVSPGRDVVSSRVVDPLEVLHWQGNDYLRGWCHQVEGERTFRVDRIVSAEDTGVPVEEHPEAEPLDLSSGTFRLSEHLPLAKLVLEPPGRWVTEYYETSTVVEREDGRIEVTLPVTSRRWLVALLSRLGPSATVVEPTDLADEVRERARAALALYR